jgi:transcriptional regulator with XRE-family HTH domain
MDMLGENIKRMRLSRGLKQTELASVVYTAQNHISQIELGKVEPSVDLLRRIAEALSCRVSELLEESGSAPEDIERAARIVRENDFIRKLVFMMDDMPPADLAEAVRFIADKKELAELRKLKGA